MQESLRRFLAVRITLGVAVVLCVLCGIVVWGLTFYSLKVAVGEVRIIGVGVGVYWDRNCDNPVANLSWGKIVVNPLQPQVSKNVTVFVKNEGSNPVVIRLNVSDWFPTGIQGYMLLSWDYDGQVLGVDDAVKVTLVLSVDSRIWFESPRIQNYSFEITVSAVSS